LLQRCATAIHFKLNGIACTQHSVCAVRKTVAIHLESMSQPWLHNATSTLNLGQKSLQVHVQVFINVFHVHSENCAKQDASESGSRVNW
jgi:hypothetical protein